MTLMTKSFMILSILAMFWFPLTQPKKGDYYNSETFSFIKYVSKKQVFTTKNNFFKINFNGRNMHDLKHFLYKFQNVAGQL